ncbi:AAA family ATPase [Solwaraspora sp. WMMA2059]|uniref:AAA family ATPase n=1 Tax=Solwaraspora sp. WMMA2059 TaxID=3015160 RepID=UPI00248B3DBF|nr:LuxR family transcriptional regulator [Solwaraspora sp. WMMA2059]WBB98268.1 AAA family ATPase [Solwaraspora sp. WMMA2059]
MLVERNGELSSLTDLLAESAAGRGRVALVRGGPATGKTELLHAFAERAAATGALVLSATGARAERELPLGVVWQLIRSAPLAPEIAGRMTELTLPAALPGPGGTPHGGGLDARAVHGLCALLLELAADRPVVIAIDDIQFADRPSLQVLVSLRRRIRPARVLLAMTEWEWPSLPRTQLHAEVARQPHTRITVAPLTCAGTADLVARRLGGSGTPAGLAARMHAITGGNPLLTHALIEDQLRAANAARAADPAGVADASGAANLAGAACVAPVAGPVFHQDVWDCVTRWDEEILVVARGIALFGECATQELTAQLLRLADRPLGPAFDVLRAAGLVVSDCIRHPVIRDILLAGIAPEKLAGWHLRAAELLYGRSAETVEVARHLVAANAVPGPWAVRLLRHAAEQVIAEDDRFAVGCLDLALRNCDDDERLALRAVLARLAWRANPSALAPHLPQLRTALSAGTLPWRDAAPVIRHLLWQGELTAALDAVDAVGGRHGPADATSLTELRLTLEWVYGPIWQRLAEPVQGWLVTPAPTPGGPLAGAAQLTLARSATPPVGSAEHALQSCAGEAPPEVAALALLVLEYAGRPEHARHWAQTLLDSTERRRTGAGRALLSWVRADLAWRRGDLAGADVAAAEALAILPARDWGVLVGLPLATMVLARTAMGRLDEAAALLDAAVPEAMFDTVAGAHYLYASGSHSLAAGRPLAAVDELERCGELLKRLAVDVPAMIPWRCPLAQAYLRVGLRGKGRHLVSDRMERAGDRARGAALRVLAAVGAARDRTELLHQAIELLERCGDRLELAYALADLSQAHREAGDLGQARLVLRRAEQELKVCQAAGGPVEVGAAVEPPAADNVGPTGVAALSEAERNVAALAALGHTNREIGRTLYITVSTVEQHLTRVYRKLKVTRRADLPSELSQYEVSGQSPMSPARTLVAR